MRQRTDLFFVSGLVLFLELACIRWFPAHVLFLSFFTNTVLLACFLGISVGCLIARSRWNLVAASPLLLVLALGTAQSIEWERQRSGSIVDVGHQASAQLVYFGVEYQSSDPSKFVIPIEAVSGLLFVLIALAMAGPGQQLGRSLAQVTNRVEAYTVNIAGSLAGILAFTACSIWQLGPAWWFGATLAGLAYYIAPEHRVRWLALTAASLGVWLLTSSATPFRTTPDSGPQEIWSPYYRINYDPDGLAIKVNLIGHQAMVPRKNFSPAYALPHLLNRDTGRPPFADVLVIGAGSGNDVSRALEWGARRVDAVEIDPVIQGIGRRDHPDQPYQDGRVFVHLDDGRNYLHSTIRQYDLIVYALVDSLVLHSSYSNIRLESYLFTTEAFADIKKRLKPGGVFVMYNYFRQGWIVSRLQAMLEKTFGVGNPIVFNLPARDMVRADDVLFGEFTVFIAGGTARLQQVLARQPEYWLPSDRASDASTPNGFETPDAETRQAWAAKAQGERPAYVQFRPSQVIRTAGDGRLATDSWPFLYLRRPMIPSLSLRGAAIMGGIGLVFLLPFLRGRSSDPAASIAQMFFLGAGFMLVETKAVVHMALLFGGTWVVNSVVFCAVLLMILAANLFVLAKRPTSLTPYYVGLIVSLVVSAAVPLDAFLGASREVQILGACLLAFTPILFAGVVFATSFSRVADPDRAFGANVAGAMFGGLSEYSSMLLGFQYVVLVAVAFYALSVLAARRSERKLA
jgi:SAM-dependent methyltransferase